MKNEPEGKPRIFAYGPGHWAVSYLGKPRPIRDRILAFGFHSPTDAYTYWKTRKVYPVHRRPVFQRCQDCEKLSSAHWKAFREGK